VYTRKSQAGCQAAFAGKPAPTGSVQNREVAEDREIAILRPITLLKAKYWPLFIIPTNVPPFSHDSKPPG
jgi:hypothetical protein